MKYVVGALLALSCLVPVSSALATTEHISGSSVALQGAGRIGNATQTGMPAGVSAEMQQVLDLVNVARMSHGLVPLRFAPELNDAALTHTQRQAADGEIYHTDPSDGSDPGDRMVRNGYKFSTWGENVAAGYRSPASVMEGWMTSPGHCRNILNPAFTDIGVGYVIGGKGYGQFWTQTLARPMDVPRPAGTYDPAWC